MQLVNDLAKENEKKEAEEEKIEDEYEWADSGYAVIIRNR